MAFVTFRFKDDPSARRAFDIARESNAGNVRVGNYHYRTNLTTVEIENNTITATSNALFADTSIMDNAGLRDFEGFLVQKSERERGGRIREIIRDAIPPDVF